MGDQPSLWLVLVVGLTGVAAVALLGTGWILVATRRDRASEAADVAADAPDIATRAGPTVEQRALRRARLRQSSDPILAGLGLDEPAADTTKHAAADSVAPARPRSRAGRAARRDVERD